MMSRGKLNTMVMLCVAAVLAGTAAIALPVTAWADDESVLGQDGGSLVLVLDGSGSMKEPSGNGQTRMDAAKKGLRTVIERLPADSKVGLRVYGSTISDGKGSCTDSELLAPVAEVDKAKLTAGVEKLKPLGNTPIAYSLKQAYKDLPKEGPRSIVLVSDGEENCGGDPCKVARDLKKRGAGFYVDVVGLQVDAASRDQLTCIASAGGGTYYDVSKIADLPGTLTRTSVRAARGYTEAGKPVEGGTDPASSVKIADGQWLDTIGDSGAEFYQVPDPGQGTLHVSASTRTTSPELAATESLEVTLTSATGQRCGDVARSTVQGSVNQRAPYAVTLDSTLKEREACGKGPYVATVSPPDIKGVKPLELLVRSEPAVTTTDGLPAAVATSGYSDDTQAEQKASGQPVPVSGSPSFAGAPPVAPGVYGDSILPGETLLYRVPAVGWGQQPVCDFTLKSTPAAAGALKDKGFFQVATAGIYSPMKTTATDQDARINRIQYAGDADMPVHVAAPAVNYLNRESPETAIAPVSLDGDYYCSLTLFTSTPDNDEKAGEIPLQLAVALNGTAGEGAPTYAEKPKTSAADTSASSDDGGMGIVWIVGSIVVALAVLGGIWALLRSRRHTLIGSPTNPSDSGPPGA